MNSTVVYEEQPGSISLGVSFDMISLCNAFSAKRVKSMDIVQTALKDSIEKELNLFPKFQTGFCHLYKNQRIVLLDEEEIHERNYSLLGV